MPSREAAPAGAAAASSSSVTRSSLAAPSSRASRDPHPHLSSPLRPPASISSTKVVFSSCLIFAGSQQQPCAEEESRGGKPVLSGLQLALKLYNFCCVVVWCGVVWCALLSASLCLSHSESLSPRPTPTLPLLPLLLLLPSPSLPPPPSGAGSWLAGAAQDIA